MRAMTSKLATIAFVVSVYIGVLAMWGPVALFLFVMLTLAVNASEVE